jgi:hypothetical protein
MLVYPRVLSLLTTRRCTATCDHCCVGASPRATAAIPIPRLHGLIDEARRVPSIRRIVFTGGECFLLGNELDLLVEHAHGAGFATRVITNGYWAVNDGAARERVGSLRASGLNELLLSTGTFHQRFVPPARIVSAARAAVSAGISVRVSVETCDQSTYDAASLADDLADVIDCGLLHIASDPWIPDAGGRGTAVLSHDTASAVQREAANGRCVQILTIVSVTPDQVLTACCGYPMEELPYLRIGSVEDTALDVLLRDAPNELLKMWLHVEGPAGIAAFVARYVSGYALPETPSICQACVTVQRDPVAMRIIAEHGHEIVDQIAAAFVRLHSLTPSARSH